ncbi:MAG TPA: hypothetical protein VGO90_09760, partial [Chthoniobacteraceae bacterium]|nr:hypothetical protein [Chthoniobacteraceae bacterium]
MSSVGHAIVRGLTFGYRPTGGVLQQARASTVVAWCVALGLVTVIYDNPLVLAAVLIAALATAARCGVGRGVSASLAFSLP